MKVITMEFGAMQIGEIERTEENDIWRFIWMHRVWAVIEKYAGVGYDG